MHFVIQHRSGRKKQIIRGHFTVIRFKLKDCLKVSLCCLKHFRCKIPFPLIPQTKMKKITVWMLRGFYRFRQSGKASNNLSIMPLCMNSKNHYKKEFSSSQLSAISSVAILNDTQRDALEYVITRSAQDSKTVASTLLARVKRLGYSENDLKRLVSYLWPHSILKEVDASPTNSGKSDSSLGVGSLSWQFSLIVKCDRKGEMGLVKSSCFFKKRLSIDLFENENHRLGL